jgi:UDPglucose--hexose-1-phosphate uridylyltransferase
VFASEQHVVVVPDPPKLPFETWLLPRRCDEDFVTADSASIAQALFALFQAVGHALDRAACNLWLHRVPTRLAGARPFHWHIELQPRTGQLAGLELGGDMYINSIPARTAAKRLRSGLATP